MINKFTASALLKDELVVPTALNNGFLPSSEDQDTALQEAKDFLQSLVIQKFTDITRQTLAESLLGDISDRKAALEAEETLIKSQVDAEIQTAISIEVEEYTSSTPE